jgi:hypothetical protein
MIFTESLTEFNTEFRAAHDKSSVTGRLKYGESAGHTHQYQYVPDATCSTPEPNRGRTK